MSKLSSVKAPVSEWIAHLDTPADHALIGGKFANLCRIVAVAPVPPAVCVTVAAFADALSGWRMERLRDFFTDLQATSGAFVTPALPELQAALADLALPDELRAALQVELERAFGPLDDCVFAVRSSAIGEDARGTSFAGVYRSTLQVRGLEQVCAAVLDCWRAYYDYPAILARARAGVLAAEPGMAVIIQRMVPAQLAGVAFTTGAGEHDLVVEYVQGLGDALVSGLAVPETYRPGDGRARSTTEQAALAQVAGMVTMLRAQFGYDLDVEWAWEPAGLAIVQVRPVTAGLRFAEQSGPHFASAALYFDETLPLDLDLGECREIYAGYVAKRAPAYRRAAAAGVKTGAAHVLSFDGAGLVAHADALDQLLGATAADAVVLDISPALRQIIVKKHEVPAYFVNAFGLTPTGKQRHAVIMRDYLRGQYGFISLPLDSDGLLIEFSADGLLAINRGLAACAQIIWANYRQPPRLEGASVDSAAELEQWVAILPAIHAFTHALNQALPGCQLEWVLEDGTPYFVDYSMEQVGELQIRHDGGIVLSAGAACGPALRLDDDAGLARMSVAPVVSVGKTEDVAAREPFRALLDQVVGRQPKPIVFARQPYAALAVLLDHVAGFVFERGSLLCHLAILLREARIPAVVASVAQVGAHEQVLIDHQHVTRMTSVVPIAPGD